MAEHDDLLASRLVFFLVKTRPCAAGSPKTSKYPAVTLPPKTRSVSPVSDRLKLENCSAPTALNAATGSIPSTKFPAETLFRLLRTYCNRHQSVGLWKGQWPEDDGLHGAEDRGRCADAEREGQHGDDSEAGALRELPACKRDVLGELREILSATHLVVPLFSNRPTDGVHLGDVSKSSNGRLARLGRMHALLDELPRAHLHVEGQLRVDFILDGSAPEPRAEPLSELHAGNSTFDTAVAKRDHCSVSAASCRRPFGVIR